MVTPLCYLIGWTDHDETILELVKIFIDKGQRFVSTGAQSVTFGIVSRCFGNKNNNCCETKICKNAICVLYIII